MKKHRNFIYFTGLVTIIVFLLIWQTITAHANPSANPAKGLADSKVFNWNQVILPPGIPGARAGHSLAYDSSHAVAVLFGGCNVAALGDTWVWTGVTWTQIFPANSPSPRCFHSMVYDSTRGVMVLFGGNNSGGFLGDTWELTGNNWIQRTPTHHPSARMASAMAYDSTRHVTVLFGGYTGSINGETWEWDGNDWTQRSPSNTPTGRYSHTMVYDSKRGVTVLFGGYTGGLMADTWEWNGVNWVERQPVNHPQARFRQAMAYDSERGVTVLFGGMLDPTAPVLSDETWEWDGSNWKVCVFETKPSARTYHAMAYDNSRHVIVLVGGYDNINSLGDTWVYSEVITYTITGRVTDEGNNPVNGVMINSSNGYTATTNISGYYTITNLISGTYTITPLLNEYIFSPVARNVRVPPNALGQDFTAISNKPTKTSTTTPTKTSTQTPTPTETSTSTSTPTETSTPTSTSTSTNTLTSTPTETSTSTSTPTKTSTPTSTSTPTKTSTPTSTATPTETSTSTSTPAETSTSTSTPTGTSTSTSTPAETSTSTSTPTETSTFTSTPIGTSTSTSTPTETSTPTSTSTKTLSPTITSTRTPLRGFLSIILKPFPSTPTPTPTLAPISLTPTPTPTQTKTATLQPPSAPDLNPIDNSDQNNTYTVSWGAVVGGSSYYLEEAVDPSFSTTKVVYQGINLSWAVPLPGKTPAVYYYRVRTENLVGPGPWSNIQQVTIYPLFLGLSLRWDGMGYIRGSESHDIGYHLTSILDNLSQGYMIRINNDNWFDPNPYGWAPTSWYTYYSVTSGEYLSSSIPPDPTWKWGENWILPYNIQYQNGQTVYIDSQEFFVSGPFTGYTSFGAPVQYWEFVNKNQFLFWDGGGDLKEYVYAGDITLRYDAGNTRLEIYSNILRHVFYQGSPTLNTVHYIVNLTAGNSFPGGLELNNYYFMPKPNAPVNDWLNIEYSMLSIHSR